MLNLWLHIIYTSLDLISQSKLNYSIFDLTDLIFNASIYCKLVSDELLPHHDINACTFSKSTASNAKQHEQVHTTVTIVEAEAGDLLSKLKSEGYAQ